MPNHTFFGNEIRRDIRDTQVTQIYKILVGEIASGRWPIDSRFPSVTQLVGESGLSRGSIQKVLARLESDGLIATEARRGTFIISLEPSSTPIEPEVRPEPEPEPEPELEFAPSPSLELVGAALRTAPPNRAPIPAPEETDFSRQITPEPSVPQRHIDPTPAPLPISDTPGDPFAPLSDPSGDHSPLRRTISDPSEARVGIALIKSDARIQSSPHASGESLSEALIDSLHEFGYKSSVAFVDPSPDWDILAEDGGPFDDPVDGIITIGSGGFTDFTTPPSGCCPVVFIAEAESHSLPCVTRDYSLGAYQATRDLIADGHSRIVVCPGSGMSTDAFLHGHREAMRRVGFQVDEESISVARNLRNGDFASLRQFLHKFRDATAILCGNSQQATEIIALCDALGIQVPTDLSVATTARIPMRGDLSGETVSGFEFPPEKIAHAALLLVDEVLHTGSSRFTQVRIPPVKIAGNSVAAPRRAAP